MPSLHSLDYNGGYKDICIENDMEPLNESQAVATLKKRGRPKGSKNRPKDGDNRTKRSNKRLKSLIKSQGLKVPYKRGRPKGSKNRAK